ncbi:hypothetical protein B2J88_09210 [Rhodococcus sp. SRB_17]|nr:hypothetical protein [Rhodococcus sp. SRB_17]
MFRSCPDSPVERSTRAEIVESSGILETMWWMVGLIILAALGLSSALVAFVFRRSTAEDRTLLGERSDGTDLNRQ